MKYMLTMDVLVVDNHLSFSEDMEFYDEKSNDKVPT